MLVIGAGGYLGSAIARAAAARNSDPVAALVRTTPPPSVGGIEPLWGDACAPDLGLSADVAGRLRESLRTIVVSVGRVDFAAGPRDAHLQHVVPVTRAVEFARTCDQLQAFVYVSSVLAVGATSQTVRSDHIPTAPRHRNFYESAKLEAERIVTGSGLPVRVVRPGHVLGSVDGAVQPTTSTAFFDLLPLLVRRVPLPLAGHTRYWIAPLDLVADVVLALTAAEPVTTAAWAVDPDSPTLDELLDVVAIGHGLGSFRLPPWRGVAAIASLVGHKLLGPSVPRYTFEYATAEWPIDLSCLRRLIDAGAVTPPAGRGYADATIAAEIRRLQVVP
jgi:nucleoside-diphosphate-sugar epimerase